MQQLTTTTQIKQTLSDGNIIAYPTEAVWGLGCDPMQPKALKQLLTLKGRSADKGLIIVAANIEQLQNYVDWSQLTEDQYQQIEASWPGPNTWVVPAKKNIPSLLTGAFETIAVRVSAHPIVSKICNVFGAITSTSANRSGSAPCTNLAMLKQQFEHSSHLHFILGHLGDAKKPTLIRHAQTGAIIRHGS